MTGLAAQIDEARARLALLERQAGHATCVEMGRHDWKFIGCKPCTCNEYGGCSLPVHSCSRCGDCDYGVNEEAMGQVLSCAERHAENA